MSENQIMDLVLASAMIVNGYAFDRLDDNVRVVNMNTGNAAVLLPDGTVSEASMDDTKLSDFIRRQSYMLHIEGTVVGCGSVVVKDVAPWTVVEGNPAKEIKKRVLREAPLDISVSKMLNYVT